MRRREFISFLSGAAAAWPIGARAQLATMTVIGLLDPGSAESSARKLAGFVKGLNSAGYIDGKNVTIEYHLLEGQYDRVAEVLADLVHESVAVIVIPGFQVAALAAKAATATIPIVFGVAEDPVKLGLVANLARPGGNATGVNSFAQEIGAKRLRLSRPAPCHAVACAVPSLPKASASIDNTARIWDAASSKQIAVLRDHDSAVYSAAFSTDGSRIVTASYDKTARIWDAASSKQIAVLRGHEKSVTSAAFSPDGSRIVTASDDNTARIWDAANGKEITVLRGHENFSRLNSIVGNGTDF